MSISYRPRAIIVEDMHRSRSQVTIQADDDDDDGISPQDSVSAVGASSIAGPGGKTKKLKVCTTKKAVKPTTAAKAANAKMALAGKAARDAAVEHPMCAMCDSTDGPFPLTHDSDGTLSLIRVACRHCWENYKKNWEESHSLYCEFWLVF